MPKYQEVKHKFDHVMVKVNICYCIECSQVGKRPKCWDLASQQGKQMVKQFDKKLREQVLEWKKLDTYNC